MLEVMTAMESNCGQRHATSPLTNQYRRRPHTVDPLLSNDLGEQFLFINGALKLWRLVSVAFLGLLSRKKKAPRICLWRLLMIWRCLVLGRGGGGGVVCVSMPMFDRSRASRNKCRRQDGGGRRHKALAHIPLGGGEGRLCVITN